MDSVTTSLPELGIQQEQTKEIDNTKLLQLTDIIDHLYGSASLNNREFLDKARHQELSKENGPELQILVDSIIGLKLQALSNYLYLVNQELVSNFNPDYQEQNIEVKIAAAWDQFINPLPILEKALSGDDEAMHQITKAQEVCKEHDARARGVEVQSSNNELSGDNVESLEREVYKKLSAIHATDYLPRKGSDGHLRINSRFDVEPDIPRGTIHVSLNHIVGSHLGGSWDSKKIIIVSPLEKVVSLNGEPLTLSLEDTWWSTIPYEGLKLPSETIIVQPDYYPDAEVISISEDKQTIKYKDTTPTEEDICALFKYLSGAELRLIAEKLGVTQYYVDQKAQNSTSATDNNKDLNIREHLLKDMLTMLERDTLSATNIFIHLARQVATRLAIEQQGSDISGPNIYQPIHTNTLQELNKIAVEIGSFGEHGYTSIERLEKILLHTFKLSMNSDTKAINLNYARQYVIDNIERLPTASLHIAFRCQVF